MINNFLQTDPGLGFQTKADSVRSTPWKKNVIDDQQMMGRRRRGWGGLSQMQEFDLLHENQNSKSKQGIKG